MLIQSDKMIKKMKANRICLSSLAPNTLSVKDSDTNETITGNCISATDGKTSYDSATTYSLQRDEEWSMDVLDCVQVHVGNSLPNSGATQPLEESKFIAESSFMRNDGSVNISFPDERDREQNKGIMDEVSPKEETNFQDCYYNSTVNCNNLSSGCEQLQTEETSL